jgi:hypothetical protein
MKDDDSIAEKAQFDELRRQEQDRYAARREVHEDVVELRFCAQIDPTHRISEDEDAWLCGDQAAEQGLLLIASAERGDRRSEAGHLDVHLTAHVGGHPIARAPFQDAPASEILERRDGHIVEDGEGRENAFGLAVAGKEGEPCARRAWNEWSLHLLPQRPRQGGARPRCIRETPPARGPRGRRRRRSRRPGDRNPMRAFAPAP